MDNLFFLNAKCIRNKQDFYIRYDFAADDRWCLTYGVKTLPSGENSVSSSGKQVDISNCRTGPQYKCPWCGSKDFVRCGRCAKLTCYDGSGTFTCAYCGNSGKVSGHIKDISVQHSGSGQ